MGSDLDEALELLHGLADEVERQVILPGRAQAKQLFREAMADYSMILYGTANEGGGEAQRISGEAPYYGLTLGGLTKAGLSFLTPPRTSPLADSQPRAEAPLEKQTEPAALDQPLPETVAEAQGEESDAPAECHAQPSPGGGGGDASPTDTRRTSASSSPESVEPETVAIRTIRGISVLVRLCPEPLFE